MKKLLVYILLVLLLSAGSETRPLNPTMVSEVLGNGGPPIPPTEVEGGQNGKPQRLSPGGPDAHHHLIPNYILD